MKKILISLLLSAVSIHAAETYPKLVTSKGREYSGVTVKVVEPDGLRIQHESGTAKIPFSELPVEIQKRHHYNAVAAEEYRKESESRHEAREAALDEEAASAAKVVPKESPPAPKPATDRATDKPQPDDGVPKHVKLRAATSSMGRNDEKRWTTSWGSYDKSIFRARVVSVQVSASTGGECIIELHWIGSEPGKASNQFVVKVEQMSVTLVADTPVNHEFGLLFVENDTKYAALGERYREGYKYSGWVARVLSKDGRTLAIQGARPPMIRFVQ